MPAATATASYHIAANGNLCRPNDGYAATPQDVLHSITFDNNVGSLLPNIIGDDTNPVVLGIED